uniref:Uncharacterized protein n=1 Tax=Parascaris equorum TaxID=6256 RepID=A0A914RBL8_PAREQ
MRSSIKSWSRYTIKNVKNSHKSVLNLKLN